MTLEMDDDLTLLEAMAEQARSCPQPTPIRIKAKLLTPKECDELLRHSVRGGNITVGDALDYREAKLEEVVERQGEAIATASSPFGVLTTLGFNRYDAVERLATLALRP